jgi:solute:Na+ symporter, SSS family
MAAVLQFKGSIYPLTIAGFTMPGYAAFYSVILNVVVALVLTIVFRGIGAAIDKDETIPADYQPR